jgi:hypothetical protein
MRLKGLGQLKKYSDIENGTRDLPVSAMVPPRFIINLSCMLYFYISETNSELQLAFASDLM